MNVVGRVGSLISQGVYSVATPFHPFGGAVDVIVVQQQDGSFRSTPWYVRFGKFQGVLKVAEKIVKIEVNGVESSFHMYLDNSGEAYFVREVESRKDGEPNEDLKDSDGLDVRLKHSVENSDTVNICRLDTSVSDPGVVKLLEGSASSHTSRLERAESDADRRFYDFQEEQSSLEGSVELSEYASNRYEISDEGENAETQGSDSEVVLVSVDGHVLTAPISASVGNTDHVQLDTPQFHLGPGEGADFVEENEEFGSGRDAWAANYISELDVSYNSGSKVIGCINSDGNAFGCRLEEVSEAAGQHTCQTKKIQDFDRERELSIHENAEDASDNNTQGDIFKSSVQNIRHKVQVQKKVEDSPEKLCQSLQDETETEDNCFVKPNENDGLISSCSSDSSNVITSEEQSLGTEHLAYGSTADNSHGNSVELVDEQPDQVPPIEGTPRGLQEAASVDECHASDETGEHQPSSCNGGIENKSIIKFEMSLCGNELHPGMGLTAAAEAFDLHRISEEEFKCSAASIVKNEHLIIRYKESYLVWEKAAPIVLGVGAYGLDLPVAPNDAIPVGYDETPKAVSGDSGSTTTPGRRWRLWPMPFRRVKTIDHTSSNSSSEEVFVDSETCSRNSHLEPQELKFQSGNEPPRKQFMRTNIPTSEQIASLNLKDGQNMVTFSFSTRVLGRQQVDAHIYLWKWNARIVISDVDGTITKSDVLGQFMPLVGKDWTQSGVARLFCAIKENGYQLLFLSARAIVQAYLTRSFLLNLKQDGKALPSGPVVISPDGLFPSLYREVIRRAPHEFKIACLEDIKALFPRDYSPFYAGFGNRDTDELSYRKIGIPKGKIFIINPKGEVATSHQIDVKSYTSLHTLVDDMFPPTSLVEQEDFNAWNYWRMPLPEINL